MEEPPQRVILVTVNAVNAQEKYCLNNPKDLRPSPLLKSLPQLLVMYSIVYILFEKKHAKLHLFLCLSQI